jgi:predicted ATP-dependent endonuclease of OLD family
MTTGLLNQYTEETEFSFSLLETIEPETLKIALKRLGNKVSEETINKIIKKIEKKEFSIEKDKYLMNLLNKIIENYLELSKTDKKINSFVEVVNKYLVNKQYIYDQSSLDLDIYDKNRRKIELSQLSSGEKQIVSIFSKIILEDKEKIIALFDEPELSLSIEWQKDFLVDLSKSENLNFLMAVTHSPFIFENLFENAFEIEVKMEDNVPYVDEEFSND